MNKFCSAEAAVANIKSGQTVASVGISAKVRRAT
jgi:acyl CoA:acetate/3-ketoacid CoA transferase alpha subunit